MELFSSQANLHSALDYHIARHNLLVSNVAHVDTPGYTPRDIRRATEVSDGFSSMLRRTQSAHLSAEGVSAEQQGTIFYDSSAGAGLDGNSVSLDREAAKLAANQSRYDVIATMMSSQYTQLAYAANDGA